MRVLNRPHNQKAASLFMRRPVFISEQALLANRDRDSHSLLIRTTLTQRHLGTISPKQCRISGFCFVRPHGIKICPQCCHSQCICTGTSRQRHQHIIPVVVGTGGTDGTRYVIGNIDIPVCIYGYSGRLPRRQRGGYAIFPTPG